MTASHQLSDSDGRLYALNGTTGALLWSYVATDEGGQETWGLRTVPAILHEEIEDTQGNNAPRYGPLVIAYKNLVKILNPQNGVEMASFAMSANDRIHSSPMSPGFNRDVRNTNVR